MKQVLALSLWMLLALLSCKQAPGELPEERLPANSPAVVENTAKKQAPIFSPSDLPYPFSAAVQVGDILYLSGEIGIAEDQKGVVPGGIVPETRRMFERIEATLAAHGLGFEDVFKCTVMLADMAEWPQFNEIYAGYFRPGSYPARSAMGVNGLALGARVEMEVWAYKPGEE